MCREKRHSWTSIATPRWVPDWVCGQADLTCASGVCGHEFCCARASCPSGMCESMTGACLDQSLPGGLCSSTADCYGGKACLGGRCCAFTQDQYEATPYYSQNVYAGCTACGGTDMWSDADKLPDGTCLSCNATTTRFDASQDSQVAVGPINSGRSPPSYHAEGACLSACGAGMYTQLWIDETMIDSGGAAYLNVYCNTLMGAGYGCSGVSSPDLTCASGVCGHEFCCEDSSCPSGMCESMTGACLDQSLPGGLCSSTADCYGGKACLGGRCCAFTQDQYEATPYYSQNVYAGCTACGGTDMWSERISFPMVRA